MSDQQAKPQPAPPGAYWLGIDLGGTKILAAVVDGEGAIVAEAKQATKPMLGPDGVVERVLATTNKALQAAGLHAGDILAVGVGAPGPVDFETGVLFSAPNMPGWEDYPLGETLRRQLGRPIFVDNDVNVGALGEYVLGAGRGASDMVGVFVGTGVGGGVIIDGRLRRGFRNSAGELGHMIVVPNGPLCGCGRQGCLEAVASRTALEREVRAGLAAGRPSIVGELLAASSRDRLTSGVIARAVAQGDELMIETLGQMQFYLGLLAANVVNFLDPEAIVFGGGVVEALGDDFLQPIRQTARAYFMQQRGAERVRITPATLGDYAGVLGAAILAGQQAGLD